MLGRSFNKSTLLAALALVLFIVLSPPSAVALDSSDAETATQEVHEAIDATNVVLNGLPEQLRRHLNADIRLLMHSIALSVEGLESQNLSILDYAVVYHLHFLADIVHSVSYELRTLDSSTLTEADDDMSRRLGELSTTASKHIDQIDTAVDRWKEIKDTYLIKLEKEDEIITAKYLNRLSLDAVRYIGISLFLVGIIAVAISSKIERNRRSIGEFFLQGSPFSTKLLLTVFFLSCLLLTILPGTLVSLSANTEVLAQEDPCQNLKIQSNQLGSVQQINNPKLLELTKQRMEMAAVGCLGVTEATAAVEQLAARMAPPVAMQPSLLTPAPAAVATRNAQIDSETNDPEALSVEFLLNRIDLDTSRSLDRIATLKRLPNQPLTKVGLPATAAAPSSARDQHSREALQKKVIRNAISKEILSQEKPATEDGDINPDLANQEARISPALRVKEQEPDSEVELYLHFRSQNDRKFVEDLVELLKTKGYKIAGVQLVEDAMTTGDIRYRHQDQKKDVEEIKAIAEKHFNDYLPNENVDLHAFYIGDIFPEKPKNRIELWIPQLIRS